MKTISKLTCPLCGGFMDLYNGDGYDEKNGYMIVCSNKSCPSTENVYGHGTTEKNAYEIACNKFRFYSK